MLGQRRRRWPNIKSTLGKRLMVDAMLLEYNGTGSHYVPMWIYPRAGRLIHSSVYVFSNTRACAKTSTRSRYNIKTKRVKTSKRFWPTFIIRAVLILKYNANVLSQRMIILTV